jgi:ATP-dependent Zn protease
MEKMRLMKEAYAEVINMLKDLKDALLALSDELYADKELTGDRVKRILQDAAPSNAP